MKADAVIRWSCPGASPSEIPCLPAGVGVNALVARHADAIVELPSASPDVLVDLDTPEDWHRWSLRQN